MLLPISGVEMKVGARKASPSLLSPQRKQNTHTYTQITTPPKRKPYGNPKITSDLKITWFSLGAFNGVSVNTFFSMETFIKRCAKV